MHRFLLYFSIEMVKFTHLHTKKCFDKTSLFNHNLSIYAVNIVCWIKYGKKKERTDRRFDY